MNLGLFSVNLYKPTNFGHYPPSFLSSPAAPFAASNEGPKLAAPLRPQSPIESRAMAITFSDLHTESGLKCTPRLSRSPEARSRTPASGTTAGVRVGGKGAPVEEVKGAAPAGDDDDLDLFGEETEEDQKAAEEREAAKKSSAKKKESGKSSVLLDVKPWDDETDMKKLEEAVRSVEMPGLFWGASKLVPVGYGIKKLQIMMTIVDDLVSVDTLIEEHLQAEPINEYVQSCDIVAFNKI
ncbi:hypothetical protein EUGRSUZ_J00657 [Eucalyptus grandis]|uniref:Uncharacterized protein n=2 Tax=Eucalyptus grandis TaxID=71139 RepID=A0ACC3J3P3_EUCGR|nr:hypothetical protein EUGRSUZ_J00657 [Eucalyptus grandis]